MFTFYVCGLETHIEAMVKNEGDGREFILTFKTVEKWKADQALLHSEQKVKVSDTTDADSSHAADPQNPSTEGNPMEPLIELLEFVRSEKLKRLQLTKCINDPEIQTMYAAEYAAFGMVEDKITSLVKQKAQGSGAAGLQNPS